VVSPPSLTVSAKKCQLSFKPKKDLYEVVIQYIFYMQGPLSDGFSIEPACDALVEEPEEQFSVFPVSQGLAL